MACCHVILATMNLQQLKYVREIVDRGLNISNAAAALHTSQPGVSRQLRNLEDELGVKIFLRNRKKIIALTDAGSAVLRVSRRVLSDVQSLRHIGDEFSTTDSGKLTIAATHTHARYALPKTIERFTTRYPRVQLSIRQGTPTEIARWVCSGEADLSIATEPLEHFDDLVLLPCYELHRIVLVKPGHPLLRLKRLTLEKLAYYPLITYDTAFMARSKITRAFEARGLTPNIVLSAADADVMKTYVKHGLGVAILAKLAYQPSEDRGLRAIDASHLFEPNVIHIGMRKNNYLREYMFDFIELLAPRLTRPVVEKALTGVARPVKELSTK